MAKNVNQVWQLSCDPVGNSSNRTFNKRWLPWSRLTWELAEKLAAAGFQ